jgi:hypothetical protein
MTLFSVLSATVLLFADFSRLLLKGTIVRPFELWGETWLIQSIVINWRLGMFF